MTVPLGYVSRPNGLLGAVVVHSDPSMSSVFARGLEVELHPRQGEPLRTRVRSAAPIRGGLRLTFDDVRDRSHAEALVGATVRVERDRLGPFTDGQYLDSDLVGLEIVTRQGRRLGRIVEVIAPGANDVYMGRAEDGAEILVPAVAHAVLEVDLDAGRMTVAAEALEYGAASAAEPAAPGRGNPHKTRGRTAGPTPARTAGLAAKPTPRRTPALTAGPTPRPTPGET